MKKITTQPLLKAYLYSSNLIAFVNSLAWFTITYYGLTAIGASGALFENKIYKIWAASALLVFGVLSLLGWGLTTHYFLSNIRRRLDISCPHCCMKILENKKSGGIDLKHANKIKNGICPHCDKNIYDEL